MPTLTSSKNRYNCLSTTLKQIAACLRSSRRYLLVCAAQEDIAALITQRCDPDSGLLCGAIPEVENHTRRAAQQAQIWRQAFQTKQILPLATDWGWTQENGKWVPVWRTIPVAAESCNAFVRWKPIVIRVIRDIWVIQLTPTPHGKSEVWDSQEKRDKTEGVQK
ncbi:Leucine--tRNA ligase [Frankliniella fusca]|uniref:Leucine--tRNA ligase n=1 Tax=Frankliniella fusca TaxID=407009 RepID=A0AAE1LE68_9NEOP|nr:Leucine--tRNA ligase [Frankliniella fusca]